MKSKLKVLLTILSIVVMTFMYSIVSYADELTTTDSEEKVANLSIGTVEIEDIKDNKEVKVPVKIENIESLCSGTIVIDCGGLEFVGLEDKNDKFTIEGAQNQDDGKVTVSFSGSKGVNGDIDLFSIKFKMPEEVENDKSFVLIIDEATSLATVQTASVKYTVTSGEVKVKKGNASKFNKSLILAIVLGAAALLLFIIMIKVAFSKKTSGAKKSIIVIILLLMTVAAGIACYKIVKEEVVISTKTTMDENEASIIAKYRYETLLNIADGSYLDFEKDGDGFKIYEFDGSNYAKIENYSESVEKAVTNEFKSDFLKVCGIIEKNGSQYMKLENIGRDKDVSYVNSSIKALEFSDNEIKAEVSSVYSNYAENKTNTLKQSFVLKKSGDDWKASEFTLPY
ncbi:MAG: hypothetical protein IKE01_02870 [Clostridia bacterium]|nr:hypothetical protein [Clostridia bacterium]